MLKRIEDPSNEVELKVDHPNPPLLVTAKQAARMLNISERTLWTITRCGEIPHVRIGRAVRYSNHALSRWVQERQKYTLPA